MEEGIDAPRGFGADALDLHQIGQRGSFDGFQRAEMQKQRAFAGRSDARNLLQTGFAQIAFAARPVRAYGKTMRLVAQAFDEIKHRIAWRQLERIPSWNKERFPAGVAVRPFGDGHDRNLDPKPGQNLARGTELPLPAVDQQEIGPG